MKNKNLKIIGLVCILAVSAFILNKSETEISREDRRDFSVSDTSLVTKIILSSKIPNQAILERLSESEWMVNSKYKARKSGVYYLLKTLQRMEIAHPVPKSMRENVLGNLAVKGIKVQVFLEDGSEKTFYVGGENQELSATFMMIQGASEPYAVHIPGFQGYLSSRFFTHEYLWRDKQVMNYDNREISYINMTYHENQKTNKSFSINVTDSVVSLNDINGEQIQNINPSKIEQYLSSFRNLYSESFVSGSLNVDSLIQTKPMFDLTVGTNNNEKTHIKVFHKKAPKGTYVDGDITMRDPERMYAYINGEDWMILQVNSFKNVMKDLTFFTK